MKCLLFFSTHTLSPTPQHTAHWLMQTLHTQPHNTLLIGSCKHYTHTLLKHRLPPPNSLHKHTTHTQAHANITHTLLKHRLPPPNSLHKHTTHTQAHTTITQKAQFQNVQVIFNGLCWDLVGVEAGGGGLGWGGSGVHTPPYKTEPKSTRQNTQENEVYVV